jgi:O-antigen/teichoic acid export membrane protein
MARSILGHEFGGFASDALHLSSWQVAAALAQFAQIALVTHRLGLHEYGRLALVIGVTVLISQFFDLNVGVAATTFGAAKLRTDPTGARSVFQFTYFMDGVTGLTAFVVAVSLAVAIGPRLIGANGTQLLILYAVVMLCSTLDNSSISILRLLDKFKVFALAATLIEGLRLGLIVVALSLRSSLTAVIVAMLIAAAVGGLLQLVLAAWLFRREVGQTSLFRRTPRVPPGERRAILKTMWHTNVISYVRLAQVQLPTVVLGAISGATQVGIYKIGTAAASVPAKLMDPGQMALLPRIARLWAEGRVSEVEKLIRRISYVSAGFTALGVILLAGPLARPVLELLGGSETANKARGVLIISALALGISAALFWNSAVLFSAGRARTLSRFYVLTGLTQCLLLVPLALWFGAVGAALALLGSQILGNALSTREALKCLREGDRASGLDLEVHPDAMLSNRE